MSDFHYSHSAVVFPLVYSSSEVSPVMNDHLCENVALFLESRVVDEDRPNTPLSGHLLRPPNLSRKVFISWSHLEICQPVITY